MSTFELYDPQFLPHQGCAVSFSLAAGELLVLWGENGIGKSTLLQRFYCERHEKRLSVIEQKALEFFFDRPVQAIIDFFIKSNFKDFRPSHLERLLRDFGLTDRLNRRLSHLSGGEGQMLKLILGLCADRDIYLLDEPSQFLDKDRKQVLAGFLEDLRLSGKTILMVEHDHSWLRPDWHQAELVVIEGVLGVRS